MTLDTGKHKSVKSPTLKRPGMGYGKCENCQAPFRRRRWKQRFCSPSCRVRGWQKRSGYKGPSASTADSGASSETNVPTMEIHCNSMLADPVQRCTEPAFKCHFLTLKSTSLIGENRKRCETAPFPHPFRIKSQLRRHQSKMVRRREPAGTTTFCLPLDVVHKIWSKGAVWNS